MSDFSESERLTTLDNPRAERVKRVAALAGRSARLRHKLILVEGPQATRELVRHRGSAIRDVYMTEDAIRRYRDIYDEALALTPWVHTVSPDVSRAMSSDSQGVIAVAQDVALLATPPDLGPHDCVVILAEAQDPGNVGTIIRSSDALGAKMVVLCEGSADIRSPKVIRSSAGSLFHLPILTHSSLSEVVSRLRDAGVAFLATAGTGDTYDLVDMLTDTSSRGHQLLSSRHAWVFGNEARGLTPEQIANCDALVTIPMDGDAESLNVATSASICLFASMQVRSTCA